MLRVAGFPTAEAFKFGKRLTLRRVQRFFVRQTIDLGGKPGKTAFHR
jgi:high affinity Mn2+ porin